MFELDCLSQAETSFAVRLMEHCSLPVAYRSLESHLNAIRAGRCSTDGPGNVPVTSAHSGHTPSAHKTVPLSQ